MKEKKFYLFRHGQTDYNLRNIWVGCRIDCPLNTNGINQAYSLADRVQAYGLQAVYSSPLKRAFATAEIVCQTLELSLEQKDLLRESDYGEVDGMPVDKVKENYPQVFEAWINPEPSLFDMSFPQGETLRQTAERIRAALDELVLSPYDNIGVASHAGAICTTMSWLGVVRPQIPNCGIIRVIYRGGQYHFDGMME